MPPPASSMASSPFEEVRKQKNNQTYTETRASEVTFNPDGAYGPSGSKRSKKSLSRPVYWTPEITNGYPQHMETREALRQRVQHERQLKTRLQFATTLEPKTPSASASGRSWPPTRPGCLSARSPLPPA